MTGNIRDDASTQNAEGWIKVVEKTTENRYTAYSVKSGYHIIICKGFNDNMEHLQEGLTDLVVFDIANRMLQTHVANLDMIMNKAIAMMEKDTPLSINTANKRWYKAKNKKRLTPSRCEYLLFKLD
jgi:hypothetical protein